MANADENRPLWLRVLLAGSDSYSSRQLALIAVASLLFAALGFYVWYFDEMGIPERAGLGQFSGTAVSKELGHYRKGSHSSVTLGLSSIDKTVYLPSKARGVKRLYEAVAIGDDVSVLVERSCATDQGKSTCSLWGIDINGEPHRTFDSISDAWAGDNRVGLWLGVGFGIGGLLCLFQSRYAKA